MRGTLRVMARKRDTTMASPASIEAVAAAAHQMWCDAMNAQGWRYGEAFDEDAKTHPGLRPFAELSAFDRDQISCSLRYAELERPLCEAVDSAFREREWSADDLHVGMRVSVYDPKVGGPASDVSGSILELKVANPASGRLDSIRVKWDDGTVDDYPPTVDYVVPRDG